MCLGLKLVICAFGEPASVSLPTHECPGNDTHCHRQYQYRWELYLYQDLEEKKTLWMRANICIGPDIANGGDDYRDCDAGYGRNKELVQQLGKCSFLDTQIS